MMNEGLSAGDILAEACQDFRRLRTEVCVYVLP